MRIIEFLLSACIALFCMAVFPYKNQHLYINEDVQVFSYSEVFLGKTSHGGAEYLNKIVFLGDSRTYGLKAFSMLDGGKETNQVWTPRNGTMSIWDMQFQKIVYPENDSEITAAEAAALKKPQVLIISLGINGVELVDKNYFASEYTKLINSIKKASPDTVVVLQSMFPVCRSYTQISNSQIKKGNEWIIEVAMQTDSYYLNTAEILCDADGYLIEEYSTDGCHLTPLGLDVQIEYICTHMVGGN